MKRMLTVTATVVVLVLGTATSASAVESDAQSIIKAKTGVGAVQVTGAQSIGNASVGIGHSNGKALESYAQRPNAASVRVMAVVTNPAQSKVDYALELPAGTEVKAKSDGTMAVFRELVGPRTGAGTLDVFGTIEAPWAVDANNRSLPTSYTYADGVLTQTVDLTGARFPVVTDPTVTGYGIHYGVPVAFIKYSRSETLWIHGNVGWIAIAMAALCGRIPGPAGAACAFFSALMLYDIKVNTDAAAAVPNRCFKQRVPMTTALALVWAYDGYTVTC